MKPRKLKIRGLNSFKEMQHIDFEKLTSKGFFGIFGPTGCGKSSILDAITYALYGKIIRDQSGFINVTEESAEVSYEFEIGFGQERKVYIVERGVKRDKKTGGYKATVVRLRQQCGEESSVLAEKKTEVDAKIIELIGLTMEDFTRAVVLPQGKFSEFLKTKPSERRDMLERIFGLQQYGRRLGEKIKQAKRVHKEKLDILKGKISQYEGVTKETVQIARQTYERIGQETLQVQQEKQNLDLQYEIYKEVWELQEELKQYKKNLAFHVQENERIEEIKEKISRGKNALLVKPILEQYEDTERKLQIQEAEWKQNTLLLQQIEEQLEKVKGEYAMALEEKNQCIPPLVAEETRLKQALEIEEEVQQQKKVVEALHAKYQDYYDKYMPLCLELEALQKEIQSIEKQLQLITEQVGTVQIEPEYREKMQKAYIIHREYTQLQRRIQVQEGKIQCSEKEVKEGTEKYIDRKVKNEELKEKIQSLSTQQAQLEKVCPGNSDTLLEKMNRVNTLKSQWNGAKEREEKLHRIQKKIEQLHEKKEKLKEEYIKNQKQWERDTETLAQLKQQIQEKERKHLASILAAQLQEGEPCPVCGSLHHERIAEAVEGNQLLLYKEKEKTVTEKVQQLSFLLKEKELLLKRTKEEEKELLEEKQEVSLENIQVSSETLEVESKKEEEAFHALKLRMEQWSEDQKKIEALLSSLKEEQNKVQRDMAKLQEGVGKEEKLLMQLKEELLPSREEEERLQKELAKCMEGLGISNLQEAVDEIISKDKKLKDLQKIEKDTREKIKIKVKTREALEQKKNQYKEELTRIKQSYNEKTQQLQKQAREVDKLTSGKIPKIALKEVQQRIADINEREVKFKTELEKKEKEQAHIKQNQVSMQRNRNTLTELYEKQGASLEQALKENGFHSVEEGKEHYTEKNTLLQLEKQVTQYEEASTQLQSNIKRIVEKLNGETLEEEEWHYLQVKRKEQEILLHTKLGEKAQKEKEVKDLTEKLEKAEQFLLDIKELEHKGSLLEELEKLVQGNKLVEFVAMSQLKYVALEASKRLKEITKGRYALELDEGGSFIMRDDYNGGLRRGTNSLSGGETFLTSLSLALALSSQIQLKGKAPLEFFFLDEGFGTLDEILLDIVMSSLEKLQSNKMSVGIISHVAELKERVPIKLIVTPASPGEGSRITMEHS